MKKEFITTNAKFVYSKNELGYQEVLDSFDSAKEITIITYNISEKQNVLIEALKNAGEHCAINIITNIPSRWEIYLGDKFRKKARDKINIYLSKLAPETLGIKPNVFFDFSNHGKIIMTDTAVYIGSANYSEESAKNTEFGFISTDKKFIEYLNSEVLYDVQAGAIPYYEYDYTALLLEANVALSAIYNIRNEMHEEVYRLHDDIDDTCYYYIDSEASLTVESLDGIVKITKEACKIASEVYDAIENIVSGDEEETNEANDIYEGLLDLYSCIEDIRYLDTLVDLSEFDTDFFINQTLQDKYAMEAYDENLDKYIEIVSKEAIDMIWNMTHLAKDDVDELIAMLDKFCEMYSLFIDNLDSREYKKISTQIDNTDK